MIKKVDGKLGGVYFVLGYICGKIYVAYISFTEGIKNCYIASRRKHGKDK